MVKFLDLWEVPLPEFMDNQYGEFAILLLIWVIIGLLVVLVARPVIHRMFAKTETDVDDKILKIIDKPLVAFIFFFGSIQSMRVLDDIPDWVREGLFQVYGLVVALFAVYIAYKVFKAVFMPLGMEYSKTTETELDDALIPLVDKIGGLLIIVIGLFWVLSILGVNVTVFIAGFGIVGIVIAFAIQDTLANFFAGVHILMDRPFREGDTLLIDGDYCRVEKIGLRSTWLYNRFDHDIVIFPNNTIANSKIINLTEPDQKFKVRVSVGVAYGSPIEKVEEIMLEALNAQPGVITDNPNREAFVRFQEFGDSALDFKVIGWIDDLFDQWEIAHNARKYIDKRFAEEGIEIPFPQRVVHIQEGEPPEGVLKP
jgi:small-conductance mechanosensitive channel